MTDGFILTDTRFIEISEYMYTLVDTMCIKYVIIILDECRTLRGEPKLAKIYM